MISADLCEWFNARWDGNMGAIDGQDVAFIAEIIKDISPRTVVEIGCASGMSTCILASLMAEAGGGHLNSFDLLDRYYVNPEKPVGYMVSEAPPHPGVSVKVNTGKTVLDVGQYVSDPIDLCFIDAAHKHPWPMIDTLGILPLMKPGGIIVHHDLQMYRGGNGNAYATGPRHVFDQSPKINVIFPTDDNQAYGRSLMKSRGISHNIFALRVPEGKRAFAARLSEGFYLGWDKQDHRLVPLDFAKKFEDFITQNYGPRVVKAWEEGMSRYSEPDVKVVSKPPTLARRVLRKIAGR